MASSMNAKRWLCDTCKTDRRVIGKLSFCAHCRPIGRGNNGCVYKGKFEGNVDIAVKRILMMAQETGIATTVESETLSRVDGHLNIVRYYATEQDEDFWFVNNLNNDKKNNLICFNEILDILINPSGTLEWNCVQGLCMT